MSKIRFYRMDNGEPIEVSRPNLRQRRKESVIPYLKKIKPPEGLSEDQLTEIVYTFAVIDQNGDGRISKEELKQAAFLIGMNPTDKDMKLWWKMADKNKDGFIDIQEYVDVMKANYITVDLEKERLKAAFSVIDKDNDGRISLKDFKAVLKLNDDSVSDEDVEELFKEIDLDGNGYIEYKEFVESKLCKNVFR